MACHQCDSTVVKQTYVWSCSSHKWILMNLHYFTVLSAYSASLRHLNVRFRLTVKIHSQNYICWHICLASVSDCPNPLVAFHLAFIFGCRCVGCVSWRYPLAFYVAFARWYRMSGLACFCLKKTKTTLWNVKIYWPLVHCAAIPVNIVDLLVGQNIAFQHPTQLGGGRAP